MSSSSVALSPDQLCYVHCNLCDTVLALTLFFCPQCVLFHTHVFLCFSISIGFSFVFVSSQVICSLTVTVRCGHCTNLLSVNMRGLLLPAANQLHLAHSLFTPRNLLEEIRTRPPPSMLMINHPEPRDFAIRGAVEEYFAKRPVLRRRDKEYRLPSTIASSNKDEIQRIKAENPDICHRDAFIAAAKNVNSTIP
ncbi:hypothetical protein V6N11_015662 [Hibiscus sabdariffa]|uniref:Uncharacterized protein n=1 Tax=Hibiscus sabdariffa TaxID=183260 RepID=A0ABR2TST0_9ROSI